MLILPVLVFTCVLNVVRSPVVASPVVDMVIVLVAGSLVTVTWVLPFNVSPSLTVAASLPTKPPKPSIAVKTAASADFPHISLIFAAADGNFWNYHITVLHFAPNDFVNFVHITLPLYIPKKYNAISKIYLYDPADLLHLLLYFSSYLPDFIKTQDFSLMNIYLPVQCHFIHIM